MDNGAAGAQRICGRACGGADEYAVTNGLGQEMVVDVYVDDGEVRLTAAVQKQLIDGVEGRGYLDGRYPAGYVQGSLLLWGHGEETKPLVGVSGGGRHELAVDILAVLVKDANLEAMTQEDFGSRSV